MIYKFESNTGEVMEVKQDCEFRDRVVLSIDNQNTVYEYEYQEIHINKDQLYDLIGALHSLQAKVKKEGDNG